ncbi:hypothetical protein [Microbacterium sp. NPDC076911]|uniref:hypothetical protein n=1 Tax=Microbacterium sp. NPDC076911 TaxID=3154958 RepID=UPI0034300380
MADSALSAAGPGAARRWQQLPAVARVALIYVVARVVTALFFLLAAQLSGVDSRFGVAPSIADLVLAWDSRWYWIVAETGYPADLPLTESGAIAENQWAFMPIYPYLAKLVSLPFGQWAVGAFLVSITAGFAASYVLYLLMREKLAAPAAMWSVVFFACGPLAGLFQIGYAESLFLLWLFLSLLCIVRRHYAWLFLLIPLMGYTRPGVLAFALFLALFGIWRWFQRHREPMKPVEVVHIVALGLWAVIIGFSWQVIAGVVTGDAGAYLSTELAWRRNWIAGDAAFAPFDGFLAATSFWFGSMWGLSAEIGYVVLGLGVAAIAVALSIVPAVKKLGVEIRLWSASYLVYLLLVFFPQSSIFRLLVPLSPMWGAIAAPRSTPWRLSVLVACLLGQWWWIYNMFGLGNTVWQIP